MARAALKASSHDVTTGSPEDSQEASRRLLLASLADQVAIAARTIEQLRSEVADTRRVNERIESGLSDIKRMIGINSRSIMWLARQQSYEAPATGCELLVSVIMPTWERADIIEEAIGSLLAQRHARWECIIVDDGSTDSTRERIERYLADPRFCYLRQDHLGVGTARNLGLAQARGQVVAYLDTDNEWLPEYLSAVTSAFAADADLKCVYTGQIFNDREAGFCHVRCEPFDPHRLSKENFVDLNVFAHRKELSNRLGGFDERLDRLGDWDLIQRYTEGGAIRCIPRIAAIYHDGRPDQISRTCNFGYNKHLVFSKRPRTTSPRLRVLYALWHYPQLSESYVRSEIRGVEAMGVEVEVWSEERVTAPFESEVPVHRGTLSEAINRVRPAVIHIHWLNMAAKYCREGGVTGLPITVRGHAFEFTTQLVAELDGHPAIQGIYLFPHLAAEFASSEKVRTLPVSFDPSLYRPGRQKDLRLVIRTGCALPTKDYLGFLRAAQLCPEHKFKLVLCHAYLKEDYLDEVVEINRQMGSPVEILVDLQHEDVATLICRAGIYLHTNDANSRFGMPISISEAMASGCFLIARRSPAAYDYVQDAGDLYESPEEAADLVKQTAGWSQLRWKDAQRRSVDRAFSNFLNVGVLEPLVGQWRSLAGGP